MKRTVVLLIICILCIPMFSVMIPRVSALVEPGVYDNPVPPGYGFINYEEGVDGQVIRSTLPGLRFTTTLGYDWLYGDVRTGAYNARSLTDPSVNHGQYVVNEYFFAWLGPNMGEGRIDFVDEPASYLSVLTSTSSGLSIDAYDSNDNLVATSGWASGNLNAYAFTRLTVQAPNMAYVIIHDTGNYWLIDDLVTDAGGQHGLGPGPVYTCVQISTSSLFICETSGQSADIMATVSDQLGNPWPGVTVHFTTSGGVLSATSAKTDSQGKATVTLSPGSLTSPYTATVTAAANWVSNSLTVIFYPLPTTPPSPSEANWRTNGEVFKIQSIGLDLPNWLISTAKAYNKIPFVQKINIAKLENLRTTIYLITKASSATQEEFTQDLYSFFGITANPGYSPLSVLILEFPYEQIINALFDQDYHEQISIPLPIPPDQAAYFDNTYLKSTPSGSFDYMITFSRPSGVDVNQAIDLLSTLADSVTLLVKKIAASKPLSVIQDAIRLLVAKVESIGDVDIGMITSDLDQLGQLSSYSIFDLKTALDRFSAASCIVLKVLDIIVNGLEGIGGVLTAETGVGLAAALWAAKGAILTILDLGLEIIDLTPWAESFRDNPLYRMLEGAIGWAATASDPEGTIIVPSVYDSSGSLVIGYNSTSSDVIYASIEGILIPIAGDWLALLHEDKDNPMNYTIVLNAVGGSAAVPYNLQILNSGENGTAAGYCGMVLGGTSITIPVNLAPDGTLIQQVYLDPALSVSQTGNIYDFVATGKLSNGSLAPVTKAFLIVNGSQYEMTQDSFSTFEIHTPVNLPGNVSYLVYMISQNVPGGFASGILTQYNVAFDQTGVGSDFSGTIVTIDGSNCDISTLPWSFWWYNDSTHTFAFQSPLVVGSGAKHYDWTFTSGLSPSQSGSITVTGPESVVGNYAIVVDDTPPTTTLIIGEPKCMFDMIFVTLDTPFTLTVSDVGSGVESTDYRITNSTGYDSGWLNYIGSFNLTSLRDGNYSIAFNSTDNVGNVENMNYINVTLVGPDINGDGKADMKDIVIAINAFRSFPGHPRWNPTADINFDGLVDMRDIVYIASMFGKHWP